MEEPTSGAKPVAMVPPEGLEPPIFGGVFQEFPAERSRRVDERGAGVEEGDAGRGRRIQRAATCGLIETYQVSLHRPFPEQTEQAGGRGAPHPRVCSTSVGLKIPGSPDW